MPGLTWPTMTFSGEMTVWMGKLEVRIKQLRRGHTKGDTIVYLPAQDICFSGDLVRPTPPATPATPASPTGRRPSTTWRR